MRLLCAIVLILFFPVINAQTFTDSNLPIVVINTDSNQEIPDSYKVGANMKIIFRPDSSRNYLTDQANSTFLNYNGRIGIELRGSSSQTLPKKPYGLTTLLPDNTNNNVSLLGMPPENDWVLNSIAFDPSLIRNFLSYDLARAMGNYAPRGVYCEVVINGSYKGLYVLMEKIKIDKRRVNITKLTSWDNTNPELSGGYLVKADKSTGGDPIAWTMSSYAATTNFIYENPKPTEITYNQQTYIQSQFTNLKNAAGTQDASIDRGFPSIIDVPSFVDFMIVSELASNADSYQFSTYFHKERNGKLRAGPVWDYDLTYGNDLFMWGFNRSFYNVWQFNNGDNTGPKFWRDLFDNPTFKCYLSRRWNSLTAENGPLNYNQIVARIDKIAAHISEAIPRENAKWGKVSGQAANVESMKSWIQSRITWITNNLGSYQACASPTVPPLVISKIHYNPKDALGHDSEDLEFIEITNSGSEPVKLTGINFKGLGLTYQFPQNISFPAAGKLYLANNAISFLQFYGFQPFGEYTRSLSDSLECIVLADAFGNTIDSVQYQGKLPWPEQANGTGYYLKLDDLNANNSLASNWSVSTISTLGTHNKTGFTQTKLYPNPAKLSIILETGNEDIIAIEIYNASGTMVLARHDVNSNHITLNVGNFPPGIYLVKTTLGNGQQWLEKLNKMH